jgi:AraC-like DNA-binding protein
VIPVSEQFSFWREAVWEAFVPVALSRPQDGPFHSAVTAWSLGPLAISTITSQAQSVVRTETEIARRRGEVFFLNLPLSTGTSATQGGRTALLAPGDFVLIDGSRPFELTFDRSFSQVSLMLPHEVLMPVLADPWSATAVRIPGDSGVGAIAAGAVRSLASARGTFTRHEARAITDHLVGLIAVAAGSSQEPTQRSASRARLLQAALDEIERSLDDADLSPAAVASAIGISTSYLHRLFADHGPSLGRWLLIRRLDRCHRDLDDPSRRHWTIAQIASQHGFRDPSYFARAFKAHYGMTPGQARGQRPARHARLSDLPVPHADPAGTVAEREPDLVQS